MPPWTPPQGGGEMIQPATPPRAKTARHVRTPEVDTRKTRKSNKSALHSWRDFLPFYQDLSGRCDTIFCANKDLLLVAAVATIKEPLGDCRHVHRRNALSSPLGTAG